MKTSIFLINSNFCWLQVSQFKWGPEADPYLAPHRKALAGSKVLIQRRAIIDISNRTAAGPVPPRLCLGHPRPLSLLPIPSAGVRLPHWALTLPLLPSPITVQVYNQSILQPTFYFTQCFMLIFLSVLLANKLYRIPSRKKATATTTAGGERPQALALLIY